MAAIVVALLGLELVHPVYGVDPGARGAIEGIITVGATVTAGLIAVNFISSCRLRDLLLLFALTAVSVSDVTYNVVPALRGASGIEPGGAARLVSNVLVAAAFATAALVSDRRITGAPKRAAILAGVAGAGSVGIPLLVDQIARTRSGAGVSWATGIAAASDHPLALAGQVTAAAVLLLSGLLFLARARRGESGVGLLGAVVFLLAGARLQYLALPAVASDWVTPREGVRVAAYALLLAAAYRQLAQARFYAASAALRAERERIARDLHDGVAQDLAYITLQAQRIGSELGPEHPVLIAARRALRGARGAIADLTAVDAPTAGAALQRVADELGQRFDLHVNVSVHGDIPSNGRDQLGPPEREHLVRIAREAIVNAALHGTAHHVEVALDRQGRDLSLLVADDGSGIADAERVGFGLRTMRARAASLGGKLTVRPRPGGGTVVELLIGHRQRSPVASANVAVITPADRPSPAHDRVSHPRRFMFTTKRKKALERSA